MNTLRKTLLGAVAVLAVAAAPSLADPGPLQAQERSAKLIPERVSRLVLGVDAGDVTVRLGRAGRVDVVSTWTVQKPTVSISVRDGVLTVEARCGRFDAGVVRVSDVTGCTTDVVVTLAASAVSTKLTLGVGDVSVTGLRGDVDLNTGAGSVRLSSLRAPNLKVTTSSGDVTVASLAGRNADLSTGAGQVSLARLGLTGRLSLGSNSGDVAIRDSRVGSLKVTAGAGEVGITRLTSALAVRVGTNSGAIDVVGVRAPAADLVTGSGDVTVEVSTLPSLAADTNSGDLAVTRSTFRTASLVTGSGRVQVDTSSVPRSLKGTSNSGDIEVRIPRGRYALKTETNSGRVDIDGITIDKRAANRVDLSTGAGDITLEGR